MIGRARYLLESIGPELRQYIVVRLPAAKVLGGARGRAKAFRPQSVVNISAMSFGSLSGNAVAALNRGAALAVEEAGRLRALLEAIEAAGVPPAGEAAAGGEVGPEATEVGPDRRHLGYGPPGGATGRAGAPSRLIPV
jgi:hypothetical protein